MRLLLAASVVLVSFGVFGFSANDGAKTISTDGSYSDTTNAMAYVVNKAQDGWVMTVGAAGGSYTWTNTANLTCTNLFTIQGGASGNPTWITFGANSGGYAFGWSLTPGKFPKYTTIKDFVFTDTTGGPNTAGITINGDGLCFRVSNCVFTNLSHANENVLVGSFNSDTNMGPFGVFDHCSILSSGASIYGIFQRQNGNPGNGNGTFSASWNYPMTWGTSNAVYVEDCKFYAATFNAGTPALDGASGARWVIRHCDSTNYVPLTAHGPDSGGISNSTLQVEAYYTTNTIANGFGQDFVYYIRGGSFYAFSNQLYAVSGGFRNSFVKFSADCSTAAWASEGCPQQYNYPADYPVFEQPGQGVISSGVQGAVPCFVWSNSFQGAFNIGTIEVSSTMVAANRDYYLDSVATNYTPYVYPHPLAQTPDPSITVQPQNQSVTVGQTAAFSVTASGQTALSYQWYKNGVSIPGATSASVSSGATSLSNNNDQYYVVVSDSAGSVQSSTAILTVNPASDFIINSVNLNVGSIKSP